MSVQSDTFSTGLITLSGGAKTRTSDCSVVNSLLWNTVMKFTSPSQDLVYVALDDTMGWGSTSPEMYSLMCVCYTLDESPTTGRVSLTDRKLKPPPKTAQRLICLNGCADSCTLCAHTSERLNLCVCRRTPQRWGYVRPHKAFPPNWPHYLHDLSVCMFLSGCAHQCVIGWGVTVQVTTET